MTMDAISWLSSGFVQSPIHLNLKWLTLLLLYWVSVGGQVNGIVINIRKLGNVQGVSIYLQIVAHLTYA